MIMHMVTFLDRRLCVGLHTSLARKSILNPFRGPRQRSFGCPNANHSNKVWSCFQWLYWSLIAASLSPSQRHQFVPSALRPDACRHVRLFIMRN
ncbi:hypothetical protein PSPO01_03971 [Paraphaeosphaeria sporulosa]